MIRALFFLIKIAVVVAAVIWIAENPGTITIDWMKYKVTFHVGMFLLFVMAVVATGIFIYTLIRTVMDAPKNIQRYRDMTGKDKGIKALTLGLAAVAAGDIKAAKYQSYRAGKFLGKDDALTNLLMAQAARLDGRTLDAAQHFTALLQNKEAAFLGLRGLLQSALESGDYVGARELGHKALEMQPKQGWLLKIVYDLEIKLRHWDDALKILYRAEKAGAIPVNKANSDRVAMLLAQADLAQIANDQVTLFRTLQKAYKTDPRFVPTIGRLARMYLDRGKRKAAVAMIEDTWKIAPHPELVNLWAEACPPVREGDGMARVRWFEKLLSLRPESVEGLLAMAGAMIQDGLWGEARKCLEKAEGLRPNVNLYKLWARLEERATQDEAAVRRWLEKAADAPRERVWICSETGRVYDRWVAISDQGLFNTIIWDFPVGRAGLSSLLSGAAVVPQQLLESPQ